ncbi:uncharacterized protein LOC110090650 isoform X3 [Pogona vitticeps]
MERTCVTQPPGSTTAQGTSLEATPGLRQSWVTQWQDFLKTLDSPDSGWGNPQRAELWGDAKTFLASFEQVAEACRWPRREWAARLLPALNGDAEQAFRGLQAPDREDYGKVKAAILRREAVKREARRQQFRQFHCQDVEDPRKVYHRLQELCHQWLKPEKHTKEQILDLLILEQFLASLPPEIRDDASGGSVAEDHAQRVALTEDFLMRRQEAEMEGWQVPFHEITVELEEDPVDTTWRQDCQEAEQKDDQDIISIPDERSLPSSLVFYSSEGQEEANAEMFEEDGNLTSVSLFSDKPEQNVLNPAKTTMYWEVKQGKHQPLTDSQGVSSTEQEPEVIFIQTNEEEEVFPVSDSDDDIMENTELARCILLGVEGEGQTALAEVPERSVAVAVQLHEQDCEAPSSQWRMEDEHRELSGLVEIQAMHMRGARDPRTPSFFSPEARRTYCLKPGFVTDQMTQTGESSYECLVCERIFQNKSHLTRHQRIHTGEKPYKCTECEKAFGRKDKLIGHQRTHHTGRKPFQPFEGEQDFSFSSALVQNQTQYSERRPYGCPECGKSFPVSSMLKRHQKVHGAKKPYECSKCRRRFRWISALKRHQKTHERLFECLECGKTFNQIETLYRHQTVHTGERRYKCSQCGQGFDQRENMLRHEKIHTEEKYQCSGCDKSFSRKDTMLRHQRIHLEENRTVKQETDCG